MFVTGVYVNMDVYAIHTHVTAKWAFRAGARPPGGRLGGFLLRLLEIPQLPVPREPHIGCFWKLGILL